MKKKLIDRIVVGVCSLAMVSAMVIVPLQSYGEYQTYVKENTGNQNSTEAEPKAVLESISAEFADGVEYYANNTAMVTANDFIVTAHYTKEGCDPYDEIVDASKISFSTASDFYAKGGDITIRYKGVETTLTATLIPVTLTGIQLLYSPYTVKYRTGETFSDAGMVLMAVYNDGSQKKLSAEDYSVDTTTALLASDEKATVSYTEGTETKTLDVAISVVDNFENGSVQSILIRDGAVVESGDTLQDAVMEVNAVYESGNRIPLTNDQYSIEGETGTLALGKNYKLTAVYNENKKLTANTDVTVRAHIEGESGEVVGGTQSKTEAEYAVVDGNIVATGNDVTFAGGFSYAIKNDEEASLTLRVSSATETKGSITMRCSNSYLNYYNGTNSSEGYIMKPLQINTVLDLTINGNAVNVADNVILKGCGPYEKYAPLYGIYYEFTFENISLDAGLNEIRFDFKPSTKGDVNCWGESPSTLNIDYVNIDTIGMEIPDEAEIESIEIGRASFVYGTPIEDVDVPVIATLTNGTRISLSPDEYFIDIVGDTQEGCLIFGKYTVNASLRANESLRAIKEFEIEAYKEFTVLTADIVQEGDKVYYVFTGNSIGYEAEDIVFFDDARSYAAEEIDLTFGLKTFTLKIECTNFAEGTYCPHLKVGGTNYVNGANANGDIRGNGLTFENGKSITVGGKTYKISTTWSMPALVVS